MLTAEDLFIKGRHTDLVLPTSLIAPSKTITLIQADSSLTRTALALALTGRMKPTSGTITHGHSTALTNLRIHTGLIDAVDVNEPEHHLKIIDLVNEDLALIPTKRRAKLTAAQWLTVNHLESLRENWIDQVTATERITLLAELALTDYAVDTLVFDTPDRHTPHTEEWLAPLQEFAEHDTIVATVLNIPESFDGPVFYVGNAVNTGNFTNDNTSSPPSATPETAAPEQAPSAPQSGDTQ